MVKVATGGRYVVGCRPKIDRAKLKPGVRITLDQMTYTIMKILPREVDRQGKPSFLMTSHL